MLRQGGQGLPDRHLACTFRENAQVFWNRIAAVYDFSKKLGYDNAVFRIVDGRMPCAIAIIRKESRLGW